MNEIIIKTGRTTNYLFTNDKSSSIPTVFLHGFTGTANSWKDVISKLDCYDRNHKIKYNIALDIVGHGKSTFNDLDYDYTIDDWCDDFDEILAFYFKTS